MLLHLIAVTIIYRSYASVLPVQKELKQMDSFGQNLPVYTQELRLPLKTFTGENKVQYACSAFPLKPREYIKQYLPVVAPNDIYHMTISVCDEPFDESPVWECMLHSRVCKGKKRYVMYAWTNGAPGWTLPDHSGVYTGDKEQYIILQVHGRDDISSERAADFARMQLKIQMDSPGLDAAIGIYGVGGYIPPLAKNFTTDVTCSWVMPSPAPILSYGLHTHTRGIAMTAYIIRNGSWIEIGRGDPVYPLILFDITERNMWLYPGDIIAARCTYDNPEDRVIDFGFSHENEMCNLFLHYGVQHKYIGLTKNMSCFDNAQTDHWENEFDNIPAYTTDPKGDSEQSRYITKHHMVKMY